MIILQIEYKVANYADWKKVFDSDPVDRKKSGVKSYQIFQKNEDPNFVIINLEFDSLKSAESTLASLRKIWSNVAENIMFNPQTRILKEVESAKID